MTFPTDPVPPAVEPAAPAAPPAAEPAAPAPATPTAPAAETVDSLPEWAQREIRAARKEAGDYRAQRKTAEQELAALREQFGVALGLKEPEAAPDPALVAAQTAAKQAAIDLAVLRSATASHVNADRLLDSASFLANVRALDHTAADFQSNVAAAITAATTADPSLKAARAAGSSGPDSLPTPGEQGRITEAELAKASPEQIVEWADKGALDHLL